VITNVLPPFYGSQCTEYVQEQIGSLRSLELQLSLTEWCRLVSHS